MWCPEDSTSQHSSVSSSSFQASLVMFPDTWQWHRGESGGVDKDILLSAEFSVFITKDFLALWKAVLLLLLFFKSYVSPKCQGNTEIFLGITGIFKRSEYVVVMDFWSWGPIKDYEDAITPRLLWPTIVPRGLSFKSSSLNSMIHLNWVIVT